MWNECGIDGLLQDVVGRTNDIRLHTAYSIPHAQLSLVKLPPQLNSSRRNGTQRVRTTFKQQLPFVMAIN